MKIGLTFPTPVKWEKKSRFFRIFRVQILPGMDKERKEEKILLVNTFFYLMSPERPETRSFSLRSRVRRKKRPQIIRLYHSVFFGTGIKGPEKESDIFFAKPVNKMTVKRKHTSISFPFRGLSPEKGEESKPFLAIFFVLERRYERRGDCREYHSAAD